MRELTEDVNRLVAGATQFMRLQRSMNRESVSGPGSFMSATTEVREWLPLAIERHGIRSIADIPCGDANWISKVKLPCAYTGYDLLPSLIDENRERHPHLTFAVLNAVTEVPPHADAILCRDLLVHLSIDHARRAIRNFRDSGARFLILTTFPGAENTELRESHPGWGWRPLDMEADPFGMGIAIDGVREVAAGEQWERWLKLYAI